MPLGSSSEAPVISPGPSRASSPLPPGGRAARWRAIRAANTASAFTLALVGASVIAVWLPAVVSDAVCSALVTRTGPAILSCIDDCRDRTSVCYRWAPKAVSPVRPERATGRTSITKRIGRNPTEAVVGPGCWYETIRYVVDGQANYIAKHHSCAHRGKSWWDGLNCRSARATPSRCHHLADDAVIGTPRGDCDSFGAFNYAEEIDGRSHGATPQRCPIDAILSAIGCFSMLR